MIKGIFITGTDTGVGKTYVAAGLAAEIRKHGTDVGVMKPAETGCRCRAGTLIPADALRLIRSAGADDQLDLVNPYRFSKPLAPSAAAVFDGRTIEPKRLLDSFRALARRHRFMIVEGAGGIMVPLSDTYSYLDLAVDLRLPVLVVARPGLGTINHTLLTIAALKSRKIKISGIVINYAGPKRPGLAEKTSQPVIERISGVRILGVIRYGSGVGEDITGTILDRG